MPKFNVMFDAIDIEVRYASGHLYFDRAGICLTDIERHCDGWMVGAVDPKNSTLSCLETNSNANFNNWQFNFTTNKAFSRAAF